MAADIAEPALGKSREHEVNFEESKMKIWYHFTNFDQNTFKLLSGTHGGMLNHVEKSLLKFGRVKDINVPKIMKIRGAAMVESLETMKELEFSINSFLRGLAGSHECLSAIKK